MTCTSCRPQAVTVEVLHVRHDARDGWLYRRTLAPLPAHTHPDATARALAGPGPAARPGVVLHSTSWRHDAEGLVLTYILLPDPEPHQPAKRLTTMKTARGTHPTAPAPAEMTLENVAAHALRHIALLLRTDPVVREALTSSASAALVSALTTLDPLPAGALPAASDRSRPLPSSLRSSVGRCAA